MPSIRRVVFDVNVLVSAAVFRGRPYVSVRLGSAGVVQSVTSESILGQLVSKLVARFAFDPHKARQAAFLIRGLSEVVDATPALATGVCRDPDDEEILNCALHGAADTIVTGDKDLLVLTPFVFFREGRRIELQIMTPAQFIAAIAASRGA